MIVLCQTCHIGESKHLRKCENITCQSMPVLRHRPDKSLDTHGKMSAGWSCNSHCPLCMSKRPLKPTWLASRRPSDSSKVQAILTFLALLLFLRRLSMPALQVIPIISGSNYKCYLDIYHLRFDSKEHANWREPFKLKGGHD